MLTAPPCARTTRPCARIAPAPTWTSPKITAERAISGCGWSTSIWFKLPATHRPHGRPAVRPVVPTLPGGSRLAHSGGGFPCRYQDRIPDRGERWGVGEVQGGHVFDRHPVPQRRCGRVDPLGRPLVADDLHSQQKSAEAFGDHLD